MDLDITKTFFEEDGRPKYYDNSLHPINIQCASQAIDTLLYFAEYDNSSLKLALKVADWTIGSMQDKNGFFYYRKISWKRVKVPMLHWGAGYYVLCVGSSVIKGR